MATYPWDTRRDISTRKLVDELRMPRIYGDTWGDPRGMVDPLALTAHAQGGGYDIQARRNAIAKRLLENQLAQLAAQATAPADAALPGEGMDQFRFGGAEPDHGIGAGAAPSPGQGGQSFTDMLGGKSGDFFTGQPPGSSVINPDRAPPGGGRNAFAPDSDRGRSAPDGRSAQDVIDAIMEGIKGDPLGAPAAPTPTAPPDTVTPTPSTPTPSTPTPEAVTQSGIPADARSPSMFADQFTPGGLPPSGNLYEGTPGFNTFGGVVTPGGRGYSGEHSDVPGAAPTGTPGAAGVPGGGTPSGYSAGRGEQGAVSGPSLGGGAILGEGGKGWGGLMSSPGTPTDYGGPLGQGREGTAGGPGAPGQGRGGIAEALAQGYTMATNTMPAPSDYDFTSPVTGPFDPGGSYSQTASTATAAQAPGPFGGFSGGRGGLGGLVGAAMSAPGAPGGFALGGFTTGGPGRGGSEGATQAAADAALGSLADQAGLSDIGSPGGQSLADQAGLSDIGNSGGAVGFGGGFGGGAAGGEGGFGGMDTSGAVGGMSTGGTGEVGSVASGSEGGIGGAGMGGSTGSVGSGGFGSEGGSPSGDTGGTSGDTTGGGSDGGAAP